MSRLEMAMIVDEAQRNLSAFNESEQAVIARLGLAKLVIDGKALRC